MPRSFVISAFLPLEGGLAVSARPLTIQEQWPIGHPFREVRAPSKPGLSLALVDPNGTLGEERGLSHRWGTLLHEELPVTLSHSPSFLT